MNFNIEDFKVFSVTCMSRCSLTILQTNWHIKQQNMRCIDITIMAQKCLQSCAESRPRVSHFLHFSLKLGYMGSGVEYTYTESWPTAWFIPTDCPQLLQLPEPRLSMHSWIGPWDEFKHAQNEDWWDFHHKWQTKRSKHAAPDTASLLKIKLVLNLHTWYPSINDPHGKMATWKC